MSKATITIEHESGSNYNISVDFEPEARDGVPHPAAQLALHMLQSVKRRRDAGEEE